MPMKPKLSDVDQAANKAFQKGLDKIQAQVTKNAPLIFSQQEKHAKVKNFKILYRCRKDGVWGNWTDVTNIANKQAKAFLLNIADSWGTGPGTVIAVKDPAGGVRQWKAVANE